MTLFLLRVERHANVRPVEPLSRRIRLAARRSDARRTAPDPAPGRRTAA